MADDEKLKQAQQRDIAELGLRESVLEKLLQLHLDFGCLGRMEDAGPLLYQLMELAYYAMPTGRPAATPKLRSRRRDPKAALN